jgi:hypothetical protein
MSEVRCPHCEKTFAIADPVGTLPRVPGDMTCPKCGDAQPRAVACRRCGLLSERMAEFARDRVLEAPEAVRAAWDALDARWGEATAHEAFVQLVATSTAYAWAAQQYRDAQRARPDDPRPAEQLTRLARMAEATLRATATPKVASTERPYKNAMMVLGLLVFLLVIGLVYAVVTKSFRGDDPGEPTPKARPTAPAKAGPPPRPK